MMAHEENVEGSSPIRVWKCSGKHWKRVSTISISVAEMTADHWHAAQAMGITPIVAAAHTRTSNLSMSCMQVHKLLWRAVLSVWAPGMRPCGPAYAEA